MTPSKTLPYDFDLPRIELHLPTAWQLHYFAEIESTNDWALERFRAQAPNCPTFVLARLQTRGRGRADRTWHAAAGNLTCSLAFPLICSTSDEFQATPLSWSARLAITSALAVWETATIFLPGSNCQIKWPNDLLVEGQKAAGILIESCFECAIESNASRVQTMVIGIGINVNITPQSEQHCTTMQRGLKPISFATAAGHLFDLTEVASTLALRLANRLRTSGAVGDSVSPLALQTADAELLNQYQQHLAWKGQLVSVRRGNEEIYGVLEGLDQNGYLLLSTADGLRSLPAGELRPTE